MKIRGPDDILTEEHEGAIGALVVAFARLELFVAEIIGTLTGMNVLSMFIVIHPQGFLSKLNTLRALCNAGDPDDLLGRKALLTRLSTLNDARNDVVHGFWMVDDAGVAYAVRMKANGKLKRTRRAMTADEIWQHAREAQGLCRDLITWRDQVRSLDQPSLDAVEEE